jgi:NMD protein affecting ribosome stability and mRNA decay
MAKRCVECGNYVPAYLNYMCEDCWQKALNNKLDQIAAELQKAQDQMDTDPNKKS